MTSCVIEKRQYCTKFVGKARLQELQVDDFFVTTPRINLTSSLERRGRHHSIAKPNIGPVEFETNPILDIHPATGKHYPMTIIKRSTASFKPTPINLINAEN